MYYSIYRMWACPPKKETTGQRRAAGGREVARAPIFFNLCMKSFGGVWRVFCRRSTPSPKARVDNAARALAHTFHRFFRTSAPHAICISTHSRSAHDTMQSAAAAAAHAIAAVALNSVWHHPDRVAVCVQAGASAQYFASAHTYNYNSRRACNLVKKYLVGGNLWLFCAFVWRFNEIVFWGLFSEGANSFCGWGVDTTRMV